MGTFRDMTKRIHDLEDSALTMPDGIASVTNEDYGVGPVLVVRMKNGMCVVIDALNLDGQYECQVGVYENDEVGELVVGISFEPYRAPRICVTQRHA